MIQIPLTADLHFSKGEVPHLEFQDVKEAETFVAYVQAQIQFARGSKRKRLEFFGDGIYIDGERLDLQGRKLAILRTFENVDRIEKIDLIYRVWGNCNITDSCVSATISQLNRELKDKDIFVFYDNGCYYIHRPD